MTAFPTRAPWLASLVALGLAPLATAPSHAQDLGVKMPPKPFGELPHPPAPDYAQPQYWAALPQRCSVALRCRHPRRSTPKPRP